MQAAGYQATTQETPRVLTRGQLEFFIFSFFYDDTKTQPVIPLDPQSYPSYRILNPSGELLAQGVAIPGGSPGNWRIGWVVPKNIELSNVNRRYLFQSMMVDRELRQFEVSFEFDVVESRIPAQEPELQQFITFVGESLRLQFKNTVRPEILRMKVTPRGQDGTILHAASLTYPVPVPPGASNLIEVEKDTYLTYYTDTPAFTAIGEYSALWAVRDTPLSGLDFEHQSINVIGSSTMFMIKSLRMIIDKLQKKLGLVFAYKNEDMLEYLNRGSEMINSYWPPSSFISAEKFPTPLQAFVILASAWWGLTAQRILYAETNYDFSGQSVTLGYNPGADIDNSLSTIKETLDTQVPRTKKNVIRSASTVGALASRPYRYRSNQVFPISQGTGNEVLQTLAILGILD